MQTETFNRDKKIWHYIATSSADKGLSNHILLSIAKQKIITEKWSPSCGAKLGIIFFSGLSDYENVISFLQLQVRDKGFRVCVVNLSADLFESDYKFKILRYGAEYFFERSYLSEPYDIIVERLNRWLTIERLLYSPVITRRIAGDSLPLIKMLRAVIEVSFFSNNNVLLLGERGVGKEQIANIIHEFDTRKEKGSLVILDCTTLNKDLSGSELFGHEKGAFTGAEYSRDGAVALAHKGTFFVDEIVEMPISLQAEFLRVIQEGTYKKVGSNIWRQSSFRLISATNKDLKMLASRDEFRKDLLDRIETTLIRIPSLDERKEDIPSILNFYFKMHFGNDPPTIEDEVYDFLGRKSYPGNVRELKNVVNNIFLRYSGKGPVTLGDLPSLDKEIAIHSGDDKWFEKEELLSIINQAFEEGFDLKKIEEMIQSIATKVTLQRVNKNKEASKILGKSERWIQLQKIKGKNA